MERNTSVFNRAVFFFFAAGSLASTALAGEVVINQQVGRIAEERMNFNFPEPTSLVDVAKVISASRNKAIVMPENVQSKVQIIMTGKVTPAEAFQSFTAASKVAGYDVTETENQIVLTVAQNTQDVSPTRVIPNKGAN